MSETERVISLDVGGMSIRSAVVENRTVGPVQHLVVDNAAPADPLLDTLTEAIAAHRPRSHERIAIAVPDPFDHASGTSQMEHKFAALHGVPLRSQLLRRLELDALDIRFVNDAAAAGAGEAAGLPGRTLVLTLGTGLGAALIDDDALIEASGGLVIGDLWTTPWIVDGSTSKADDRFSARGLARALGVRPPELPQVIADPDAADAVAAWAADLGSFVEEIASTVAAERVLIGGGVAAGFDRFARQVDERTSRPVRQAKLGANAPLLGAASLAFGS